MSRARKALAVNQVFAYRLRDARLTKQWSQQDLAEAMARVGHPINRATIAKIEAGARGVGGEHGRQPIRRGQTSPRGVSLEEAIALAVALDVPPPSLFLPIVREDDVELAPRVRVDVDTAHEWVRGDRPLDPTNGQFYRFQRFTRRVGPGELERFLAGAGIEVVEQPRPTRQRRKDTR
jgi:transcriptional regulator with XRE-family HTH domain